MDVLKWFLMALSGRPGISLDISAHLDPNCANSLKMSSSSFAVKGDLSTIKEGATEISKNETRRKGSVSVCVIVVSCKAMLKACADWKGG